MKKVFIVHGFNSSPNSSWLPWLMAELKTDSVYACSLAMPNPGEPQVSEWVAEIERHVSSLSTDEVYLVGYSLGVAGVLHYAQSANALPIKGAVLVSGRYEKSTNPKTAAFYEQFGFEKIKNTIGSFAVLHGDNDEVVPFSGGEKLAEKLGVEIITIPQGGHLNGSAGWTKLPQALEALRSMM